MKGHFTSEQIESDRARLIARNPFAVLIDRFVNEMEEETLDVIFAEPGMTLDNGLRFVESEGVTPETMYSRIYTIADRGHWLKRDVWIHKHGNIVTLYKYDPKKRKE